jgi:hypothetical protein
MPDTSTFADEARASFTALLEALTSGNENLNDLLDSASKHASNAYSQGITGAQRVVADALGQLIGGVGAT